MFHVKLFGTIDGQGKSYFRKARGLSFGRTLLSGSRLAQGAAEDQNQAAHEICPRNSRGATQQDYGLDQVYIQAKRYAFGNNIGPGAIRDFFGSLDRHKATKGLFVTTSIFSSSAIETAQYLSKRIVLIDGEQLAKLMIRHNVGCRVEDTLQIKRIDEDFFE